LREHLHLTTVLESFIMTSISRRNFLKHVGIVSTLAALDLGFPGPLTYPLAGKSPAHAAAKQGATPWYAHEFIADDLMNERVLFFLGHAWQRMADLGEVLDTVSRIEASNTAQWRAEWFQTADRLLAVAQASETAGHTISAGETYLRVAQYYLAGLIYASSASDPDVRPRAEATRDAFVKGLQLLQIPGEYIEIPYEDSAMPAYFFRSPLASDSAPVIIAHQGQDASVEDILYLAEGCIKRGYHCLLLHHPGQGLALRLKGLTYRPDWENVISPAVDYVIAQPGVDPNRIAIMGYSFGGGLILRAAAFESRVKICIANPPVYSWNTWVNDYLFGDFPELGALLNSDPAAFDAAFTQFLSTAPEKWRWWVEAAQWKYGASSPSDLFLKFRDYDNSTILNRITCTVLIMDGQSEWVSPESGPLTYDALTCPKEYLYFEDESTGSMHCQTGAVAVSSQRMFDWLDEHL
jgi:pimeloyl-ACP methyl ester carboxylesterase